MLLNKRCFLSCELALWTHDEERDGYERASVKRLVERTEFPHNWTREDAIITHHDVRDCARLLSSFVIAHLAPRVFVPLFECNMYRHESEEQNAQQTDDAVHMTVVFHMCAADARRIAFYGLDSLSDDERGMVIYRYQTCGIDFDRYLNCAPSRFVYYPAAVSIADVYNAMRNSTLSHDDIIDMNRSLT